MRRYKYTPEYLQPARWMVLTALLRYGQAIVSIIQYQATEIINRAFPTMCQSIMSCSTVRRLADIPSLRQATCVPYYCRKLLGAIAM